MTEGSTRDQAERPAERPHIRRRPSAQETRERRRRVVTWALSITLGVLLVNALIGDAGYLAYLRIQNEEATLKANVARIRIENRGLQQQGRRLQNDPTAIEEAARRELGLVKPGETLVILRDAEKPTVPATGR